VLCVPDIREYTTYTLNCHIELQCIYGVTDTIHLEMSREMSFTAIPQDVISTLGEYMNIGELYQRRGIDPQWDLVRDHLLRTMRPSELLDAAVEYDDPDLASDVISIYGSDLVNRYLRYAVSQESFNVAEVLLDAWAARDDNNSGDLEAIDAIRRLNRRRVSNNALSKLFRIVLNGRLQTLTSIYGIGEARNLFIVGLTKRLIDMNYVKRLLIQAANNTRSGSYKAHLSMLMELIRWSGEVNGNTAIADIDNMLTEYTNEMINLNTKYRDDLLNAIQNL